MKFDYYGKELEAEDIDEVFYRPLSNATKMLHMASHGQMDSVNLLAEEVKAIDYAFLLAQSLANKHNMVVVFYSPSQLNLSMDIADKASKDEGFLLELDQAISLLNLIAMHNQVILTVRTLIDDSDE